MSAFPVSSMLLWDVLATGKHRPSDWSLYDDLYRLYDEISARGKIYVHPMGERNPSSSKAKLKILKVLIQLLCIKDL